MMKFALLASGSKGNCCLIQDQDSSIVIDCGSTKTYLKQCFETLKCNPLHSDALFITHTHRDHISQLKMFNDITTYARCDLDTDYFHNIEALSEIQIKTLKVKEIPLSHDSGICSGYIIENEHRKLVYITDTGYVKEEYLPLLQNADYYIFESNHDIEMLMQTNRPMYIKQRIIGDKGHLCNEDSAYLLSRLIGEKTKEVVLAHISEEGNHRGKAKDVLIEILNDKRIDCSNIKITSAPQFQIIAGGDED